MAAPRIARRISFAITSPSIVPILLSSVMQVRQRKRQTNPRAPAGAVAYFDVTSVRPRDRVHKRQSQSVPTGVLTSDEALKDAVAQFGRKARSIVFDKQMGLTMVLVNTYLDAT